MASQIDMTIADAITSLPLVRAGTIKAYGVTTKTRSPSAPDIPTLDEAGLPGFDISLWQGLWLPKGTPKNIIGGQLLRPPASKLSENSRHQQFREATPWHFNVADFLVWQRVLPCFRPSRASLGRNPIRHGPSP